MSTPAADLLLEIQRKAEELKALKMLWDTVLPAEQRPDDKQFNIWLNRYTFPMIVRGIQRCGEKFQVLRDRQNKIMDLDYMLRYASGVMAQIKREREAEAVSHVS